jgi:hypothetical protein
MKILKSRQSFKPSALGNILILTLALLFGACGKNSGVKQEIVKDVNITTSLEDENVFLNINAVFKIGSVSMTSITLPVVNPNQPDIKYGEISFKPTLTEGYNEIGLSFNLSAATEVKGGAPTLPNGEELPIGGFGETEVVELAIESINSKIYLAFGQDATVLGFAIAIKEFDVVKDAIPGANIFLGFDIKGVLGMVGLFTGEETLQSGLGFFLDLSSVFTGEILDDLIAGNPISEEAYNQMQSDLIDQNVQSLSLGAKKKNIFKDIGLTRRNLRKLNKAMKKLGNTTVDYVEAKE